jgi:hypothetical protein
MVRRSADPDGPRVILGREQWKKFVAGLKEEISTVRDLPEQGRL